MLQVCCDIGIIQGGPKIKKKEQGLIFFELTPVLGLTKYVSGRLSIYGNDISIFGRTLLAWCEHQCRREGSQPQLGGSVWEQLKALKQQRRYCVSLEVASSVC